jgi:hypothetical protein
MSCARMTRVVIVGSTACAPARGTAEPCLKFGNAIRRDRAVLHRERPNHWTRHCATASYGMRSGMPVHLSIFTNKQIGCRHSSVTEHAPRKDETEVRFLLLAPRFFSPSKPLKHCRRCSRLVSGRAGFDSSQGHQAALAHSVEHRGGISEVRGSKPRRSTNTTFELVAFSAENRHPLFLKMLHVPVAQSAEALLSEGRRWGFESSSGHQFGSRTQTGKAGWLKPNCLEIRLLPRAPASLAIRRSSPTGRGSGPKPRSVQDRSLPAAPTPCPSGWQGQRTKALSSEEERRSYKPKVEIS